MNISTPALIIYTIICISLIGLLFKEPSMSKKTTMYKGTALTYQEVKKK